MKKLVEQWWFWCIIALIILLIVVMSIFRKGFKDGFNEALNKGVGSAGISKEEFEEIQIGMSQLDINSIIDKQDEWDDDSVYEKCCKEIKKTSENHIYTYQYKYLGEQGGYAIITYTADYSKGDSFVQPTVIDKKEVGLK